MPTLTRSLRRLRARHARRAESGFTLIELLVVITILGILAAVVVFSVKGIGDRGQSAATTTEANILRTAEEANCARFGTYTDANGLKTNGLLASLPSYNSVIFSSAGGNCGGTSFAIGSAGSGFTSTSGPRILAASNTTGVFNFLAQSFVAQHSAIQFSFGSSSTLAGTANSTAAGDDDVLFASADEANVNATISTSAVLQANQGSAGTCTAAFCGGIAATKAEYTVGQLVAYSCKSGATILAPAVAGATKCAAPVGGFLTTPPATAADIVALLVANPTFKLAIAAPGTLPPGASPPTAPYGLAAYQALTSTAAGGGGLSLAQFNAYVTGGQIVEGSNVGNTQVLVENGSAQMALLPKSFEVSPAGNDTNNWTQITPALHDPIRQWAVVLNHGSAADQALGQAFLTYVISPAGQAALAAYGYDPIS
jgi:prepilin-type N-terminal cleavage/methylation domain-containing protein